MNNCLRYSLLITFVAALLCAGMNAQAAPDDTQNIDARIAGLKQTLQAQQTNAQYWEYGWGTFDTSTMIWSAASAAGDNNRINRNTDIVQASESLIGLADVIFRPLPAFNADKVCAGDPMLSQQDKLDCLTAAQAMLEQSAERAHEPYEWLPHLGNLGFNLAAGLIVWKTADRSHAFETAIPGEIIGEIQLWTTPAQPMKDRDSYQLRFGLLPIQSGNSNTPATGLSVAWRF